MEIEFRCVSTARQDTPTHRPTQQTNTQTATSGGATEPFGPAPFRRRRNPKFFTGPDVRANFREFSFTFRPSKLQSKREKKKKKKNNNNNP